MARWRAEATEMWSEGGREAPVSVVDEEEPGSERQQPSLPLLLPHNAKDDKMTRIGSFCGNPLEVHSSPKKKLS